MSKANCVRVPRKNALINGYAWRPKNNTLRYSFPDDASVYGDDYNRAPVKQIKGFSPVPDCVPDVVEHWLDKVTNCCDLKFDRVNSNENADIRVACSNVMKFKTSYGETYDPCKDYPVAGDIWLLTGVWKKDFIKRNAYGSMRIGHEIGHALGLWDVDDKEPSILFPDWDKDKWGDYPDDFTDADKEALRFLYPS